MAGKMTDLLLVIKGFGDETRETSDSLTDEQIKDFETMHDNAALCIIYCIS